MTKPPAFQLYVKDWLSDSSVRLMGPAAKGLYIDLLCHQWLEGSIPSSETDLALLVGYPISEIWPKIRCRFRGQRDGRLFNRRLDEQRQDYERNRKQKSKAGRASAKKRSRGKAEVRHDSTPVEDSLQQNANPAVCSLQSASAVTEDVPTERAMPDVDNSEERWNDRLAPIARELGGEGHVGNWLRWAKSKDIDECERIMLGFKAMRDRGALWVKPGEPCTPAVLTCVRDGQPIENAAVAEYWRITGPAPATEPVGPTRLHA